MDKKIIISIIIAVVLVFIVGIGLWLFKSKTTNPNEETPEVVETPPAVNKINSMPLARRPYVTLIPRSVSPSSVNGLCFEVDLGITHLKNNETESEFEMEYTTDKSIRGVFGRRDFTDNVEHDPLFFGSKSAGKTKCDTNISGGNLKLTFMGGSQEYTLREDYTVQNVGLKEGMITSKDVRLMLDGSQAFSDDDDLLIMNTFGLPAELMDKVILGPYGVFLAGADEYAELDAPVTVTLQSKDAENGKVQFFDGSSWSTLESEAAEGKITFEIKQLGVIVLSE